MASRPQKAWNISIASIVPPFGAGTGAGARELDVRVAATALAA